MSQILLKNGKIFQNQKLVNADLLIENDLIVQIAREITFEKTMQLIDCRNKVISPSFIDGHVHTRTPGLEHKEDLAHFTNACIHAGILDVVAMGNIIPTPDSLESYDFIQKKLQNPFVNIFQVATITKELAGKEINNIEALSNKTYIFSDDGAPIWNEEIMKKIIALSAKLDLMVLLHEESRKDDEISEVAYKSAFTNQQGWKGLSHEYESAIIYRDLKFLTSKKSHLHFQHLSTEPSLQLIKQYHQKGFKVTTEITPHHLIFSSEDIFEDNAFYKMNPPLGNREWKDCFVNELNNGFFDAIVTDHAPHTIAEKNQGFANSAYGIIGVDTLFASLYTHLVLVGKSTLEIILLHLTEKPAKLFFKNETHKIAIGNIANLVILDLDLVKIVDKNSVYSKAINTPFWGQKLQGWAITTIKNGKIIFDCSK